MLIDGKEVPINYGKKIKPKPSTEKFINEISDLPYVPLVLNGFPHNMRIMIEEINGIHYITNFKVCEEVDSNAIFEKISPEQKEIGQRVMSKDAYRPLNMVKKYLDKKWGAKFKLSRQEFGQKKEEYFRLNTITKAIINLFETYNDTPESIRKMYYASKYFKNNSGNSQTDVILKASDNNSTGISDIPSVIDINDRNSKVKVPVIFLNLKNKRPNTYDFFFKSKDPRIQSLIREFILRHEFGHAYEYIKDYVEKGEAKIIDNETDFKNGTATSKEILDSEGKANAYAFDTMYRKDRRELLKNSPIKVKSLEKAKNKAREKNIKKVETLGRAGADKHSKTLRNTLKSIKKENKHKKELKEENYFNY